MLWTIFLLPRNAAVSFIKGWRAIISPLYGNVCRFHPSCSAYGLGAVQQYGLVRGGAMTFWRILRCNPWSRGGIDDVPARMDGNFPLSRFGFVLPRRERKMMPDILGMILWPFRWVIEALLVGFHWTFTQLGMNPSDGWTWVLAITGLVLVVRAALIPLFVRQIKSQRKMLEVAPDLKRIQDKYKGKRDQFSREAMTRETMALYGKHGTSPFSSCLPLLFQMPVFFGLFTTLSNAAIGKPGIGFMGPDLSLNFGDAMIFGDVPLHAAMSTADGNWAVIWTAGIMVVLMTVSQFITQKQIMSKNISKAMKESPTYKQQQVLLYILPLVFLFSGFAFPLGVMMYWLVSNFWTMGQQFVVIRNMPTPGSDAYAAWEARQEKKNRRKGIVVEDAVVEEPKPAQRQQPIGKNRAKRGKGKK